MRRIALGLLVSLTPALACASEPVTLWERFELAPEVIEVEQAGGGHDVTLTNPDLAAVLAGLSLNRYQPSLTLTKEQTDDRDWHTLLRHRYLGLDDHHENVRAITSGALLLELSPRISIGPELSYQSISLEGNNDRVIDFESLTFGAVLEIAAW